MSTKDTFPAQPPATFSPGDQVVTPDGREATVRHMDPADRDFYRVPEGSVVVRPDGEPDDVHYPASDLRRSDKGRVHDVAEAERMAHAVETEWAPVVPDPHSVEYARALTGCGPEPDDRRADVAPAADLGMWPMPRSPKPCPKCARVYKTRNAMFEHIQAKHSEPEASDAESDGTPQTDTETAGTSEPEPVNRSHNRRAYIYTNPVLAAADHLIEEAEHTGLVDRGIRTGLSIALDEAHTDILAILTNGGDPGQQLDLIRLAIIGADPDRLSRSPAAVGERENQPGLEREECAKALVHARNAKTEETR